MGQFQSITVRHNIEVAHRLYLLPGKCENIHGHSMWVELEIMGTVDSAGLLEGMDFGTVKKAFRGHLDDKYDHNLLLNLADPWASPLQLKREEYPRERLPGLRTFDGDPTTENIARWVGEWAEEELQVTRGKIKVNETHVNAASYSWYH